MLGSQANMGPSLSFAFFVSSFLLSREQERENVEIDKETTSDKATMRRNEKAKTETKNNGRWFSNCSLKQKDHFESI